MKIKRKLLHQLGDGWFVHHTRRTNHICNTICFFDFFLRVKNISAFCLTLSAFHSCWCLQTANPYGTVHLENGWILFHILTISLYTFIVFVCRIFVFRFMVKYFIATNVLYTFMFFSWRWERKYSKKCLQIRNTNNTSAKEKRKQTTPTQCA